VGSDVTSRVRHERLADGDSQCRRGLADVLLALLWTALRQQARGMDLPNHNGRSDLRRR
jgi:hypothetical protein